MNAAIYVEDSKNALAVAVDRTQGGASLLDGSVELMVQRRTLADDARGVGEAFNETAGGMTPYPPYGNATRIGDGVVIKGKHRIMVGGNERGGGATVARSRIMRSVTRVLLEVGRKVRNEIYWIGFFWSHMIDIDYDHVLL